MKIVIIGAGISGLAAAWYLNRRFGNQAQLIILEKSDRIGGWIRTVDEKGFLFEQGPRGFRPAGKGKTTLALVKDLGLEKDLIAANAQAKKRYLLHKGTLQPFSLPFLIKQGLLGALLRDLRTDPQTSEDETIADFFRRRFNPSITESLIDPLVKGIFGGDMETLSVRSCFPTFWEWDQKGSILLSMLKKKKERPPASLYSFTEGMETLPKRLAERIDAEIHLSTEVNNLEELEADYVISTLSMPNIEHATITTVSLGWEGELMKKRGYGFLVPRKERENFLGMTWDSDIFPEQNRDAQTRICVMIDGEDKNALSTALTSVEKYLEIKGAPDAVSIRAAKEAIPQYTLGHPSRIERFKQALPPHIRAIGMSFQGVGVNDCIENARLCCAQIQAK